MFSVYVVIENRGLKERFYIDSFESLEEAKFDAGGCMWFCGERTSYAYVKEFGVGTVFFIRFPEPVHEPALKPKADPEPVYEETWIDPNRPSRLLERMIEEIPELSRPDPYCCALVGRMLRWQTLLG